MIVPRKRDLCVTSGCSLAGPAVRYGVVLVLRVPGAMARYGTLRARLGHFFFGCGRYPTGHVGVCWRGALACSRCLLPCSTFRGRQA